MSIAQDINQAVRAFVEADKKYLEVIGAVTTLPRDDKEKPNIKADDFRRIREAKEKRDEAEKRMYEVMGEHRK